MEPHDDCQYHRCALRELREEAVLPSVWMDPLSLELASFPTGQSLVELSRSDGTQHRLAIWVVRLPDDVAYRSVRPTKQGATEMVTDSLKWRPVHEVMINLEQFPSIAPFGAATRCLVADCELCGKTGRPSPTLE